MDSRSEGFSGFEVEQFFCLKKSNYRLKGALVRVFTSAFKFKVALFKPKLRKSNPENCSH